VRIETLLRITRQLCGSVKRGGRAGRLAEPAIHLRTLLVNMGLRWRNCRSLRYATPDFLLSVVALAILMRLSLTKAAYAAMSSAAWQEIRVRSGRDDKG
jgi:G:T-mismatch repair DNA endonuclease (very short patch repair protein)